jgi:putative Holliday junction resolvase
MSGVFMRILGIDFGDVRIGVAVSDPMGWTAQMVETIHWRFDTEKPLARIVELVRQYPCDKVVVGLPRNMDGSSGFRVEKTLDFIRLLEERIPAVPVETWDERLTTVMAQRAMHEMGIRAREQKGKIDQMAAAMILQGYLDAMGMRESMRKE